MWLTVPTFWSLYLHCDQEDQPLVKSNVFKFFEATKYRPMNLLKNVEKWTKWIHLLLFLYFLLVPQRKAWGKDQQYGINGEKPRKTKQMFALNTEDEYFFECMNTNQVIHITTDGAPLKFVYMGTWHLLTGWHSVSQSDRECRLLHPLFTWFLSLPSPLASSPIIFCFDLCPAFVQR